MQGCLNVFKGRIAIKQVAEAAGVSAGTVSKALNGGLEISETTRTRVRVVAQKLGYRPMAQARGLARGRTGNVAVAVRRAFLPVFSSAFYSDVLAGVEAELERHDLSLLLTSLKHGDDLLRLASERRADGVLYIGYDVEAAFLRQLRANTPLVVIDGEVEGVSSVVSDNLAGSRAATRHLLERGRRRLVFVTMTLLQPNFSTRHQGFLQELREAGLEPGPTSESWGFAEVLAALEVLLEDYKPDGIVCANDAVGYLVLQALETLKVPVPRAVAVVGYDGTADAEYRKARLSTVMVDKQRLGEVGVQLLLGQVARPDTPPQQITVPTYLEPGDTS